MTGISDNNRSEGQGGDREGLSTKEVWSEGTVVGIRTGYEAMVWAISVREATKSDRHRKTHHVEPDGAGRKSMHLTRGGLLRESVGGVSRGHSSEEVRRKAGRAKGRRTSRRQLTKQLRPVRRGVVRNRGRLAKTAGSPFGAPGRMRWIPWTLRIADGEPGDVRREVGEDA